MSWTWWGTARWHEDILSGCTYRDIAASGRAGWPTAPCRAAEVPMSSPFGLAAQGGRNRLPAGSGTIRCFCFYAAVDDKCSIPAINAASQIMTVNSHIVLPRICMKYQNMLIDILAAGECLGRGLSTDCKFTYSSMHARRIQCMRAEF